MDSYVKSISVDVNAEENYTMVKAKQGDKINRKLAITLKKDGANFTPSGVSEIWFRVEKPDKNIVIVKSTDSGSPISVSGNIYTVDLTEQCLTASGEAWCDIAFLDDSGNTLSSAAFVMKIIPMPNGDSARSSSAWTDLQNAIDNIEAIVQEQLQPAIDDAERFSDILAFRVNNGYIQYTVDSETWINLMPASSVGIPDSNNVLNRSEVSGETVSQALNWLKNNSGGATSDNITNESTVTGQTVTDALNNLKTDKAPLASPEFTGTPKSTTPESADNSTRIATTAFIKALLSALSSGDIDDDSDAGGSTVKASLSSLKGAITGEQEARESAIEDITALLASIENGDTATRNYGYREFVLWKGDLYVTKTQISNGTAFSSSNLITISDGGFNEIQSRIGNLFASYTVFNNLSDLAASINSRLTGEFIIAKISGTLSPTFFEDNTTKTSILIINKASSSNAYYLATTQDNIAIGNISLTSETVTVRKDLAAKSNSLQLNSSISYPAYLTTGLWRTGNDGTINLAFPCTSLKESTNYTTTSTVSLNIFMPGSADAATQALNKAITNVERITTDYIVLQIAAVEGIPANRIGLFSTRTAMTITAT